MPSPKAFPNGVTIGSGAAVTMVGRAVAGVIQLGTQAILARLLGPFALGLWAVGWAVVKALGSVLSVGLTEATTRFGMKRSPSGEYQPTPILTLCVGAAILVGLAASVVVFSVSAWMGRVVFGKPLLHPVFLILSPALAAIVLMEVASAGSRLTRRTHYSVVTRDLGPAMAHLILVLGVSFVGWGLLAATTATTISFVVGGLLSWLVLVRLFPGAVKRWPSAGEFRETMAFTRSVTLIGVFGLVASRADLLLIGFFLDPRAAGLYNSAVQLSFGFAVVMGSFNAIFGPVSADLFRRGELSRLQTLYRVSAKWGLYVSLPILIPLILMSSDVLGLVFGDAFRPASPALAILVTAQLINVGTGSVGVLLLMTGHESSWTRISSASALVAVTLGLILIPRYGIVGGAIATAISTTSLLLLGVFEARRQLQMWPYDARYLKGLLAAASAALSVITVRRTLVPNDTTSTLSGFGISLLVFFAVLWLGGLDAEDREFLAWIRAQVLAKRGHIRAG